MSAGEAWKVIADSPEFRGLLATGASLLQGVLVERGSAGREATDTRRSR